MVLVVIVFCSTYACVCREKREQMRLARLPWKIPGTPVVSLGHRKNQPVQQKGFTLFQKNATTQKLNPSVSYL